MRIIPVPVPQFPSAKENVAPVSHAPLLTLLRLLATFVFVPLQLAIAPAHAKFAADTVANAAAMPRTMGPLQQDFLPSEHPRRVPTEAFARVLVSSETATHALKASFQIDRYDLFIRVLTVRRLQRTRVISLVTEPR